MRLQVVADPPDLAADGLQFRGEVLAVDAECAAGAQLVQFPGQLVERVHGLVAVDHGFELLADLGKLGLVDHQLASQVHQLIEPVGVHPHGLRGALAGCGCARLASGSGRCASGVVQGDGPSALAAVGSAVAG